MQGLIVAAGQGTRLRSLAISKPLAEINGVALIERVIGAADAGGIGEFVVVTGYEADRVEAFLADLAQRLSLSIDTVRNPLWERANGLSVAAAAPVLGERFVLMMADHLVEPSIFADLLALPADPATVTLAIDRRLDNPLVDLSDVTRVKTDEAGRILAIGKGLADYDAFDTGVFLASHALIEAIEADVAEGGVGGISEGMRRLAAPGRAQVFDIGDRFWLDIDDETAHGHAVRLRA
jgi:choline kinase